MQKNIHVSIVGAGLSGLSLALSLHDQGITSSLYELRPSGYVMGGAIMLSPNALRVLDSIGRPDSIYSRVKARGYSFDRLSFVNNADHKTTDFYYFGSEQLYGYHALRIYRQILIDEMLAMLRERNIDVHYERKFSHVVRENSDSVTFALSNGEEITTDLLVGGDGIHSHVRKYLSDVVPQFGGLLAITTAIPTSSVRLPMKDYPLPVQIQGKAGGFVLAPQDLQATELLIGTQMPHPALDREGWSQLLADKSKLMSMLTANKGNWNEVVQSAMEAAQPEMLSMWAFHTLPKLERWFSQHRRVVLVGDAAHAVPPSAGQGVNQAFEDTYALSLVLKQAQGEAEWVTGLDGWQKWRMERVEKVLELTRQANNKRLPEAERQKVENPSGGEGQLAWLYDPRIEERVAGWIRG